MGEEQFRQDVEKLLTSEMSSEACLKQLASITIAHQTGTWSPTRTSLGSFQSVCQRPPPHCK